MFCLALNEWSPDDKPSEEAWKLTENLSFQLFMNKDEFYLRVVLDERSFGH